MNKLLLLIMFLFAWITASASPTVTYDPAPSTPLNEIPEKINITIDPMSAPPAFVISSGTAKSASQIAQGFNPLYLPVSTVIKGELLEQVQATGEFTITLTADYGEGETLPSVTYKIGGQKPSVNVTYDPDPATPLAELPEKINITIDPMSAPPAFVISSGSETSVSQIAQGFNPLYLPVSTVVKGELLKQVETTGQFTVTLTTDYGEGETLPSVTYSINKSAAPAFTITYTNVSATDVQPSIPSLILFQLSKSFTTAPAVEVTSEHFLETLQCIQVGSQYIIYLTELSAEMQSDILATGSFTITVVAADGSRSAPLTFKVKVSEPEKVTATFTPAAGTEFNKLPETVGVVLSKAQNVAPTYVVKTADASTSQLSCRSEGSGMTNFVCDIANSVSDNVMASIAASKEFTVELTLSDGTKLSSAYNYKELEKVTATYSPTPDAVLDEIPRYVVIYLSEETNTPPSYKVTCGDMSFNGTATRNGAKLDTYYLYLTQLGEALTNAIYAAGEFTLQATLADGRTIESVTYKVDRIEPFVATYNPAPDTEFATLPDYIDFSLSKSTEGITPRYTIASGSKSATGDCVAKADGNAGCDFRIPVLSVVDGDLLAAVKQNGTFTVKVTIDGTDLDPAAYKLKLPVTATFDPKPGEVLDDIPYTIGMHLSEVMRGLSPTYRLIGPTQSMEGSFMRDDATGMVKYQDFMAYISYYMSDALKQEIKEAGEFTLEVTLNDGSKLAPEVFLVKKAVTATYNPAPDTKLAEIPKSINFTLSEAQLGALPSVSISCLEESVSTYAVKSSATEYSIPLSAAVTPELEAKINEAFEFTIQVTLGNGTALPKVTYQLEIPERPQGPIVLGYCDNDLSAPGNFLGETGGAATVSAAIRIPAARMMSLKGGKLTGIRFATAAGLERCYAWIRTSLSTPAVVLVNVGNAADGWNEVTFPEPYEITGEEIFIGYQAHQPAGIKGIRTETSTVANPDACWLAVSDKWSDLSGQGYGNLMIQAVGEGNVALNDLMIAGISAGNVYYQADSEIELAVTVANAGSETVSGYALSYSIDGAAPVITDIDCTLPYQAMDNRSLSIGLNGLADGMHTLTVACSLTGDAADSDENNANNSRMITFGTYQKSFGRTMLLEEFTTIQCSNCPKGKANLEAAVEGRSDVAVVAHHVGFGTDELTVDGSSDYLAFDVPGAPSLMIDRTLIPSTDVSTPPFAIGFANTTTGAAFISAALDYAAAIPAFVNVEVAHTYDPATRRLDITADLEKLAVLDHFAPDTRLTLFLTESNILSKRVQSGADETYRHDHAVRAILTPTFGDDINWQGLKASAEFTTTLDPAWKASEMQIVAVVNKPLDASDVNNSQALNSAACDIDDPSSALGAITADSIGLAIVDGTITVAGTDAEIAVFDLQGRRLENSNLTAGVYIVKVVSGSETITLKSFVK